MTSPANMNFNDVKTFVFTTITPTKASNVNEIELIAIHSLDVLGNMSNGIQPEMPRIYDKLLLRVSSEKNISLEDSRNEIFTEFLKIQARPACFVLYSTLESNSSLFMKYFSEIGKDLNMYHADSKDIFDSAPISEKKDSVEAGAASIHNRISSEAMVETFQSATSLVKACISVSNKEKFQSCSCIAMRDSGFSNKISLPHSIPTPTTLESKGIMDPVTRQSTEIIDPEKIPEVATFVLFDLETSDLKKRRITELYMAAIPRLELAFHDQEKDIENDISKLFLAAQEKLRLTINPGTPIDWGAARVSGLTLEDLQERQKDQWSSKTNTLICDFLKRQHQPSCILAFNGNSFDFKILKRHLGDIGCKYVKENFASYFTADVKVGISRLSKKADVKLNKRNLDTMFEKFVGNYKIPERHSAEGDVNAMLAVIRRFPPCCNIFEWFDRNKAPFDGPSRTPQEIKERKRKPTEKLDENHKENTESTVEKMKRSRKGKQKPPSVDEYLIQSKEPILMKKENSDNTLK